MRNTLIVILAFAICIVACGILLARACRPPDIASETPCILLQETDEKC